jgi:hypothetical protein
MTRSKSGIRRIPDVISFLVWHPNLDIASDNSQVEVQTVAQSCPQAPALWYIHGKFLQRPDIISNAWPSFLWTSYINLSQKPRFSSAERRGAPCSEE